MSGLDLVRVFRRELVDERVPDDCAGPIQRMRQTAAALRRESAFPSLPGRRAPELFDRWAGQLERAASLRERAEITIAEGRP